MTEARPPHLAWAATFALLLHGAALALLWQPGQAGGTGAGGAGLSIGLGLPAGASGGSGGSDGAPGKAAAPAEEAPTDAPETETPAVAAAQPAPPVETVEPVEAVEPIQAVPEQQIPLFPRRPEPEEVAAAPPPEPTPPEPTPPARRQSAAVKLPVQKPGPPEPTPEPQQAETVEEARTEIAKTETDGRDSSPRAGAEQDGTGTGAAMGRSGDLAAGTGGAGTATAGGGIGSGGGAQGGLIPDPQSDYLALLQAWLERHKSYPRRARSQRIEGDVLIRLVLGRKGSILGYRLERSSGFGILDEAVRTMIDRANPMPAMPPTMRMERLELVLPVTFRLQ